MSIDRYIPVRMLNRYRHSGYGVTGYAENTSRFYAFNLISAARISRRDNLHPFQVKGKRRCQCPFDRSHKSGDRPYL
ncbi:hypothetical protein D3C73_1392570 [compost metagenome]